MKYLQRLFYIPAWPIAAKLSAALLSAAIIPMGFSSYYNLQQSLSRVEAGEYRKLELLAVSNASRLDQLISDIQRVVIQVSTERHVVSFLAASTPEAKNAIRASMQSTLDNVFRSSSDYDAVFLIDRQGKCLASTDPTFLGQDYAFREYFQRAMQGQAYISGILVGETTKRPGLFLTNPVRSTKGEIVGVAVLKIKGADIWAIVNELQVDFQSYAFLIDEHGVIISHPNKSYLYQSLAPLNPETQTQILADKRYGLEQIRSLEIPQLAKAMVGAKETGHTSYYSPSEQTQQIIGYTPLEMEPWVLGVSKPKALFAVPLNHLIWENSRSLLLVGAIASIIALLFARSIAKPIRALTTAAQALEQDDFDPDVLELRQTLTQVSRPQDDIGQLVRVFLHMAEQVRLREQKLKQQVLELHIEIDEAKKARQVAEVTGTEYFQQLQKKAQKLKGRTAKSREMEGEYFQQLQQKAQQLKGRAVKTAIVSDRSIAGND